MLILLLEPLPQIFRSNVTCFAISQVAAGPVAKSHETQVRQPQDRALAIDEEFAIHGVAVPRGNAVPAMRELALVAVISHFRGHVESVDELAHRACIRNGWIDRSCRRHDYFLAPTSAGCVNCWYMRMAAATPAPPGTASP